MDDAIILDIGPVSNRDPIPVSPDNRAKPDTNLFSEQNIADNCCIGGHEKRLAGDLVIHMHNNIGN